MEQTNVRLVDRVLDVMETLARYPNGVTIATLTAETNQPYIAYLQLWLIADMLLKTKKAVHIV